MSSAISRTSLVFVLSSPELLFTRLVMRTFGVVLIDVHLFVISGWYLCQLLYMGRLEASLYIFAPCCSLLFFCDETSVTMVTTLVTVQ